MLTLQLIKSRKSAVQRFVLLPSATSLLKEQDESLSRLLENKKSDDYVIRGAHGNKRLSREHLTKQINMVLKKVGASHNKNLSSHSFRIGYITGIIKASDFCFKRKRRVI